MIIFTAKVKRNFKSVPQDVTDDYEFWGRKDFRDVTCGAVVTRVIIIISHHSTVR